MKYVLAGIATTAAFLMLLIWGWNPHSGFFFVLVMFFAGTGTQPPPSRRRERPQVEQFLASMRWIFAVGAMCTAGWVGGTEFLYRVAQNPVFILFCWLWTEFAIIERYHQVREQRGSTPSMEKTPRPDCSIEKSPTTASTVPSEDSPLETP